MNNRDRCIAFSLGLDFLYLVVHLTFFALISVCIAKQVWTALGIVLAWGQWLAAGLDVLENLSLLPILFGSQSSFLALGAMVFARIKFLLIIGGVIYVIAGLICILVTHRYRLLCHDTGDRITPMRVVSHETYNNLYKNAKRLISSVFTKRSNPQ